jgi:uncharacterized repeat protein (TIGR03803 family)
MKNLSIPSFTCIIAVFCIAMVAAASAQTLTTLANFNKINGFNPVSLIQATDGNFYGVTYYGGTPTSCSLSSEYNCGTVFKVTPAGQLTTLYSFCSQPNCSDGANPRSLIQASNGNFYGVAEAGGTPTDYCNGCGTIFEITPSGVLTTLYTFCLAAGCPDGMEPMTLIQATNGNFYGVAWRDGADDGGNVFELSAAGKFTILYNFCAQTNCPDGALPVSLVQASNKNLYGSNQYGGKYNAGSLFEITLAGKLTTLDTAIRRPNAVIQGANGNLYGTTISSGPAGGGTIFEMTPGGKVGTLHDFCSSDDCPAGFTPDYGLAQGSDGNFYGTTSGGGIISYGGTVFEITPTGTFSTVYMFCSLADCADGESAGALIQATNGDFYGLTGAGGSAGDGTVFSLSTGLGPFVAARPGFGSASQVVTILGNNLTGTTSVTFNGTTAKFKVVSGTYIEAQIPSGATTGTIEVTTPSGTLNSNLAFQILP